MEKPAAADRVINIGSGRSYTVSQVARLLAEAMGSDIRPEIMRKARAGDIRTCFADITRARDLLVFRPKHPLEASLGELAGCVKTAAAATDRACAMPQALDARELVAVTQGPLSRPEGAIPPPPLPTGSDR